jgi:hypothetical protein
METAIEPVVRVRDWAIDRIHELSDQDDPFNYLNALAIADEFEEWIHIPEGTDEIDYLCMEQES